MRLIDSDKIVLDYSGLAFIPPNDFFAIAKYFADQIKAMPEIYSMQNDYMTLEQLREKGFEPVTHGFWNIEQPINYRVKPWSVSCSVCGWSTTRKTNYCSNCGAKMDVDTNLRKPEVMLGSNAELHDQD